MIMEPIRKGSYITGQYSRSLDTADECHVVELTIKLHEADPRVPLTADRALYEAIKVLDKNMEA